MHHADAQSDRVMRRANGNDLAVDQNLAAVGGIKAVRDAHRGGFTGAVLTHDGVDSARRNAETYSIVRQHFAKAFGDVT